MVTILLFFCSIYVGHLKFQPQNFVSYHLNISLYLPWHVMMLFQSELGWSVLELLGRTADSGCRTPLQKQETKRIDGGSPIVSPMPKSILFGGREYQLLRVKFLCVPFTDRVAWYL